MLRNTIHITAYSSGQHHVWKGVFLNSKYSDTKYLQSIINWALPTLSNCIPSKNHAPRTYDCWVSVPNINTIFLHFQAFAEVIYCLECPSTYIYPMKFYQPFKKSTQNPPPISFPIQFQSIWLPRSSLQSHHFSCTSRPGFTTCALN